MATNIVIRAQVEALGPGVRDREIAAVEAELGQEFPEVYRDMLRTMNGFVLLDGVFHRPRSPEHPKPLIANVHIVMGVGHKSGAQDLLKGNRMGDRPPKEAFAFATDSGGNSFILYTLGPRRGEVAFRDHEWPFNETKLTDSMEEFFARLVDAEAPEVLADSPPVEGHAVKIVARKVKGGAKKTAGKKVVSKTGAPKKTSTSATRQTAAKKLAPKKTVTTATRKTAAKKAATKKRRAR